MKEIFKSKEMVGFMVLILSLVVFSANRNTNVEMTDTNNNEIALVTE